MQPPRDLSEEVAGQRGWLAVGAWRRGDPAMAPRGRDDRLGNRARAIVGKTYPPLVSLSTPAVVVVSQSYALGCRGDQATLLAEGG